MKIFSTKYAFTAVKADGSVHSWGFQVASFPATLLGVTDMASTERAFAAIYFDSVDQTAGKVQAWGSNGYGNIAPTGLVAVTAIFSNQKAFCAMSSTAFVCWGMYICMYTYLCCAVGTLCCVLNIINLSSLPPISVCLLSPQ